MSSVWSFITKPTNRQILSWIGGGLVIVATGTWAVVTYVWPPPHDGAKTVCAQQGVVFGGNVSGSRVTNTASGTTNTAPCIETSTTKK